MRSLARVAAFSAVACFLAVLSGCEKTAEAEVDMNSQPYLEGKKVFLANCASCHRIGGRTNQSRAPNLAKTGADAEHTADWFIALIRDPKSKNPKAQMRAFHDSIKDDDLHALAEFLVSLK